MKMKNLLMTTIAIFGLAIITGAQVPSYVPNNGLVGWWPFNGNANDVSGNGNNGTVNGAILTSDRFGNVNNAYTFDGVDDKIIAPVVNPLQTNWSISFWFNSLNINSNFQGQNVIGLGSDMDAYGGAGFQISGQNPPGQCPNFNYLNQMYILDASQECGGNFLGGGLYSNSTWYNVVIIKNNSNYDLVVNNVLMTSSVLLDIDIDQLIFGNRDISFQYFKGNVDDIGAWNRAITQQEITALYISDPSGSGSGSAATNTVPAGISYQAVARNAQGQPLSDAAVQVKFTLLTDSLTGAAEYSESHSLTTNSLGLFTTAFGAGTAETGTFAAINWASGTKYLKVELDAGTGFVDMGTQQLLSVPYSMRSNTSAKAGTIENAGLPVYADNAAALAGGLVAGQMYRTATGNLKIVY